MPPENRPRLAILYPGDRAARDRADPAESRFAALFEALSAAGIAAEPAIYHDAFADEVRDQLLRVQAVLVWHNPIEGGRTRARTGSRCGMRSAARMRNSSTSRPSCNGCHRTSSTAGP